MTRKHGRLVGLLIPIVLCAGCLGVTTSYEIIQEIPSPSGAWKAVVTHWEPPGGPLADTQYTVHVVPAGDRVPMWVRGPRRAHAPWFSEWVHPTYVFWRDDQSLVVLVSRAPGTWKHWLRETPTEFKIETRLLSGLDKGSIVPVDGLPLVRSSG